MGVTREPLSSVPPYSSQQITQIVEPWKAFLADIFDQRHTTALGLAFGDALGKPSAANAAHDTYVTKVRRILNDDRHRPEPHNVWTFAAAARATGVKWLAGPLALLAAGHIAEFVHVMAAASLFIRRRRLEDLLYAAPAACEWSGQSADEMRAGLAVGTSRQTFDNKKSRSARITLNRALRDLEKARGERLALCRAGDTVERRTWRCSTKETRDLDAAWSARARFAGHNVLLAASLVERHLELDRRKRNDVVVSVLASWL